MENKTSQQTTPPEMESGEEKQPVEEKEKGKIIAIGAIVLLVIIIAVGSIVLSKNGDKVANEVETNADIEAAGEPVVVDPLAGWNTFSTEDWAYEVKYPADWVVQRNIESKYQGDEHLTVNLGPPENEEKTFYIQVSKRNPNRLNITNWLEDVAGSRRRYEPYREIGGVEAVAYQTQDMVSIALTKGDYVFMIEPDNLTDKELSDILDTLVIKLPQRTVYNADFTFPYPVAWEGEATPGVTHFSLIGVSLGPRLAPRNLTHFPESGNYEEGSEIYALTLRLRIDKGQSGSVPLTLRRILDETGTSVPPNTRQFSFPGSGGSYAIANTTFTEEVVFVVTEEEKDFLIFTGGYSNIPFSISVVGDALRVETISTKG